MEHILCDTHSTTLKKEKENTAGCKNAIKRINLLIFFFLAEQSVTTSMIYYRSCLSRSGQGHSREMQFMSPENKECECTFI